MTPTPPSGIPVAIAGQLQRDDGQDRGPTSPRSPRDGAMTARETYARGVGSYEGQ